MLKAHHETLLKLTFESETIYIPIHGSSKIDFGSGDISGIIQDWFLDGEEETFIIKERFEVSSCLQEFTDIGIGANLLNVVFTIVALLTYGLDRVIVKYEVRYFDFLKRFFADDEE